MITINANYYFRVVNFGDRVTPFLLQAMYNVTPIFVEKDKPHILGCGSILQTANENSIVWGSGLISGDCRVPELKRDNLRAVRGLLTLERLNDAGKVLGDIALGDPGSLLPRFYEKESRTKYSFGVIPHYVDKSHIFLKLCKSKGGLIIDPQRDLTDVIDDILSCKKILSSSLHGLILSDAYGVKNRWIELSKNVYGDGFKFHDYYSTRFIPQDNPDRIDTRSDIEKLLANCSLSRERFDLGLLYDAVPKDKSCFQKSKFRVDVSTIRKQRRSPIPIFVYVKDRKIGLKRVLRSLKVLNRPYQVVVHDLGSKRKSFLKFLERTSHDNLVLYNSQSIPSSVATTGNLASTIAHFLQSYTEPVPYIVANVDAMVGNEIDLRLQLALTMLDNLHAIDRVTFPMGRRLPLHPVVLRRLQSERSCIELSKNSVRRFTWDGGTANYFETKTPGCFDFFRAGVRYSRQLSRPGAFVASHSYQDHVI